MLTKGYRTIVDDEDYERLNSKKWCISECATSMYAIGKRNGKKVYMHREILGHIPPKMDVDHINGDSLDNRKFNLRIVTRSENARNKRGNKQSTSQYKGVSFVSKVGKWQATLHLGLFDTEQEAAIFYDKIAEFAFGEFTRKNI